jgi:hypothetical protein
VLHGHTINPQRSVCEKSRAKTIAERKSAGKENSSARRSGSGEGKAGEIFSFIAGAEGSSRTAPAIFVLLQTLLLNVQGGDRLVRLHVLQGVETK